MQSAILAVYAESLVFESNFGSPEGPATYLVNESDERFTRLLGEAALTLWPSLPREVQEQMFRTAALADDVARNSLAVFLHERHPRTTHPSIEATQ
jgi:hypothetical protein